MSEPVKNVPLQGSCLCRGIRYEVAESLQGLVNCHCSMCRKATGAAFRTRATVKVAALRFLTGADLLTYYQSSPGEYRSFCRVCGSTLITKFDRHPDVYGLALGTLDTDPGIKPLRHVFTKFKAPWFDITDGLPQVEDIATQVLEERKGH